MLRIARYRNGRYWALWDGSDLVVVTLYKKGFQEQTPSCRARHDGDYPEYQIMPSTVGARMWGNDFIRSSSA